MRSRDLLEMFEDADQELDYNDDVEELAETLSEFDDDEIEEALAILQENGRIRRMAGAAKRGGRAVGRHLKRNKKKYAAGAVAGGAAGGAYAYRRRKRNQAM